MNFSGLLLFFTFRSFSIFWFFYSCPLTFLLHKLLYTFSTNHTLARLFLRISPNYQLNGVVPVITPLDGVVAGLLQDSQLISLIIIVTLPISSSI